MEKRGHFAAMEEPGLMLADLRKFIGLLRLSIMRAFVSSDD